MAKPFDNGKDKFNTERRYKNAQEKEEYEFLVQRVSSGICLF